MNTLQQNFTPNSEIMISQSSRARKTNQRALGVHTMVKSSRQQAFKDVKAGLTEIKKNLKVNQSMMSNRHKQLQKQKPAVHFSFVMAFELFLYLMNKLF